MKNLSITQELNQIEAAPTLLISKESYIQDSTRPDRICLTGVEVILKQNLVSPERNLIVRAETVEIAEAITLPGRAVHIFAREIKCVNGVYIDVSGKTGKDYSENSRANDGSNDGEAGSHGADGGPGQKGGTIHIMADRLEGKLTLRAKGGKGGSAQNGGNGAKGKRGNDGRNDEKIWYYQDDKEVSRRANAGRGYPGGTAGNAGLPGKGGDGGLVIVVIYGGLSEAQLSKDVAAGQPGAKARAGRSGEGGEPGNAGSWTVLGGAQSFGYQITKKEGKPSTKGLNGREASPPRGNTPGTAGTADIQNPNNLNEDYFGEQLTPMLGRILLRQACLDHLNGHHEEAAKLLAWLYRLLAPQTPRAADSATLIDADAPGEDTVPDHEYEALRSQTALQVRRLELGLDAYGNPPTFIPMMTYKAYEDYTGRWLESARRAESLYQSYINEAREQSERMEDLKNAINDLDMLLANLQQNLINNTKASNALQDDIAKDLVSVQQSGGALMHAANDFKQAVENHSQCGLGDILKAASALVAIGTGGVGAIAAVGVTIDAIRTTTKKEDGKDKDKGFSEYFSGIAKESKVVVGKINDISKAYQELKGVLSDGPSVLVPSDEAKILAEKDQILKTIEEFKSLPEATEYKQAIDKYMNLVLARNQKILDHDALALQAGELQNVMEQARKDMDTLKTRITKTNNPALPEFRDFMERILDLYKTELVRGLSYAHRALAYLSLTDQEFTVKRESVAFLEYTYRLLDQRLLRADEERGRDHQILRLGNKMAQFSLKSLLDGEELNMFRNRKAVDFIIPEEKLSDYYHVYATKVRPVFHGTSSETTPAIRLIHSGNAKFHDKQGLTKTFTHTARTTIAYHAEADGASLGQSHEFISLSPYGPWRIDLDLRSNKDISFEELEDIVLEFELKYLPRD